MAYMEDVSDEMILDELRETEETVSWLSRNWNDLQDMYEEEYVALRAHEIIAHDPELEALREMIDADPSVIVEYFPPKGTAMLL